MKHTSKSIRNLVLLALLSAIVVVLQLLGSFIHLGPFSISLVLVPIVIGSALLGVYGGAWLGFVFGVAVLLSGDAAAFLAVSPLGAILTVLIKGAAAGLAAGAVYRLLQKKNRYVAVTVSAFVCPIVNTGVFLIGCLIFFMPILYQWAEAFGFGSNVGSYIVFGLVGGNFLFEMLTNLLLCPVIMRLLRAAER